MMEKIKNNKKKKAYSCTTLFKKKLQAIKISFYIILRVWKFKSVEIDRKISPKSSKFLVFKETDTRMFFLKSNPNLM